MFAAPLASAQSFQPLPSLDPREPQAITPKYVAAPPNGKSILVPASAAERVAALPDNRIVPAVAQVPPGSMGRQDDNAPPLIPPELPGPQRLFKRESENDFFERLRRDMKRQGSEFLLPEESRVSKVSYTQPTYPRIDPVKKTPFMRMQESVEPNYIVHRRLLFEQPNFERIGWDLGILQPGISLGLFYYDVATLPYHVWSDLDQRIETSAGKCLPGDPAPLRIMPEHLSVSGLLAEAGTVIGIIYFVPNPGVR